MSLIENHFKYLGSSYKSDDIEDWKCFEMDCEGHLVSLISLQTSIFHSTFQLSNESIEHLSNFPHLRNLEIFSSTILNQSLTNISLLSNLRKLSITFERAFKDPKFFKDLGLLSNLLSLDLYGNNGFENYNLTNSPPLLYILLDFIILPPSFSNLSNLVSLSLSNFTFPGFKKNPSFNF